MCLIVDTNTFSCVFSSSDVNHDDFEPVLKWILDGYGIIIYGGTKYLTELKKTEKYLKLFRLLKDAKMAINIADKEVDESQKRIMSICTDKNFDDPHLVAICDVSDCIIICSKDARSVNYIKNKKFYKKKNRTIPKYYSSKSNANILCDKNIPKQYKKERKERLVTASNTKKIIPIT